MTSQLLEREQQLLSAIIDIYTKTAEPVSSNQVCVECSFNCSAATIRNIMLKLEEQGYLSHPYTSAGKIPTYKAYQFFIHKLRSKNLLNNHEEEQIRSRLINSVCETEHMLRLAARILALTSDLMAVVWITSLEHVRLQKIQLIGLNNRQLLLIAYLDNGEVHHQPFESSTMTNQKLLDKIVTIVNQTAKGRSAEDLKKMAAKKWQGLDSKIFNLLQQALLALSDGLKNQRQQEKLMLEGTSNLISQPEFDNIMAVRQTMTTIEHRSLFTQSLLEPGIRKGDVTVSLGEDKPDQVMPALSVISNQLPLQDGRSARLAIVGPRRMAYNRLISVMDCTATTLNGLSI